MKSILKKAFHKFEECLYPLVATGTIAEKNLEPTDETTYVITIKNRSRFFTANNVMAHIELVDSPVEGVKVTPDDRYFGDIKPRGTVSKEISIVTERAPVGDHQLSIKLSYSASISRQEIERTHFQISHD